MFIPSTPKRLMANRENLEISNLNSQNFDPNKYLHSFLKTNNIKSLIQKNIELEQDIKNYDQDIQSLVFENYNKFIISIETVKKMKENIIKVDEKLKVLNSSMGKINGLVSKIDDNLKVKRNEIQKLDTVNKDLQKLKKICEFPDILKNDIQEYQSVSASNNLNFETMFKNSIEYYKTCFTLLNKLKTEPLIKPIYFDSINKIEEMRSIIWNLQTNKNIDMKEMRSIIKKLLIIIEDKELVLKNYLKFIKDRLIFNLKSILDSYSTVQDDGMLQEEELTRKFLEERKYDVTLEELETFKTKSEEDLAQKEVLKEGTCLNLISKLSQNIFPDIHKEISFLYQEILPMLNEMEIANKALMNDESNIKQKQTIIDYTDKLENIVKEITMVILTNISEKLAFLKLSNMQVNDAFKKLNTELNNLLSKHISRMLRTEIIDKFSENVEQVFRSQLFDSFSNMRFKFIQLLLDLKNNSRKIMDDIKEENELETIKKDIFSSLNFFKNKLYCIVATSLIEMKPFIQQQDNFLKSHLMFFSLLHAQFTEFIKLIVKIMVLKGNKFSVENITGINSALATKFASSANIEMNNEIFKLKETREDSSYYLIINQFLIMFEKKLLYKYFEILFDLYHKNSPSDLSLKQQYQSLRMNIENNEIPKLTSSLKLELNRNLLNYSEFYYEEVMNFLKSYLHPPKWTLPKAPAREISAEVEKVIPVFKKILIELSILFPDLKRGIVKKNSFIKFKSALDIDMERILAKKSHHFEKTDLNRNVVLLSILKSMLKGIIEHIRRVRFDKGGFEQLQIDMFFIVQICYEMVAVDDESLIIGFYFEMMQNAGEMASEIVQVEQSLMESIANNHRGKFKI